MKTVLDFERPIVELEAKLSELQHLSDTGDLNITDEVIRMRNKIERMLTSVYSKLTPWQKVQVARHPDRPHFVDYVNALVEDFTPLAGDRYFAEDRAIIGGLGRFRGQSVMIIGQEKGRDTNDRVYHNFGMPRPEGYRKAVRLMRMAEKFGIPVVTLVDTPGAHPGVDAEERGQSEAIARGIEACLDIRVPLISIITGEGMSGGAIAICAGNEVHMLEHSIYTVISPEGCASILWRTGDHKQDAAETQRLTAQDLKKLHVIDEIIPEPLGGAHRHFDKMFESFSVTLQDSLERLSKISGDRLRELRREKYLQMGIRGL